MALRAHNPQHHRSSGALSAGETHSAQGAASSLSVADRAYDDRRSARTGVGVRGVAEELGRAASTVSRELRRNTDDRGRYHPVTAQRLSSPQRSRTSRKRRLVRDEQLQGVVTKIIGQAVASRTSRPRGTAALRCPTRAPPALHQQVTGRTPVKVPRQRVDSGPPIALPGLRR